MFVVESRGRPCVCRAENNFVLGLLVAGSTVRGWHASVWSVLDRWSDRQVVCFVLNGRGGVGPKRAGLLHAGEVC